MHMESHSDQSKSTEKLPCHSDTLRNIINHQLDKLEKCSFYERPHRILLHLNALENERIKLDAFKKELPFCVQLLHEAIQASKEQLALSCQQLQDAMLYNIDNKFLSTSSVPREAVSQRNSAGSSSSDSSEVLHVEKMVQSDANTEIKVWNPRAEVNSYSQQRCQSAIFSEDQRPQANQEAFSSSKPTFLSREKTGGAFMPFNQRTRPVQPVPRPGAINPADLELVCPTSEIIPTPIPRRIVPDNSDAIKSKENIQPHVVISAKSNENTQLCLKAHIVKESRPPSDVSNTNLPVRKARRSWSPDLHRLFLEALQKLGGSQATPKQIREAMNVDGLTNDEIKSHLQKYRLHTRRIESPVTLPLSSQVLLAGGTWGPAEQIHQALAAVDTSNEFSMYDSRNQFKSSMCAEEQLPS